LKKLFEILLYLVAGLFTLILLAVIGTFVFFPRSESPPDIQVSMSSENIARGAYLTEHVAMCFFCHSQMNPTNFGVTPDLDTRGHGL